MAEVNLQENCKYELHSSTTSYTDKSNQCMILHVKLTDSALTTVEEFHKLKDIQESATIRFNGNQGVIIVPGSSNGDGVERKFCFLLSSVYGGQDGSFECIRQSAAPGRERITRSTMLLESVGVMTHKLTVQASDDVYEKTLVKMSLAEEQSKKTRTKEIRPSGSAAGSISRRVRNVTSNNNNSMANFGSVKSVLARRSINTSTPINNNQQSSINSSSRAVNSSSSSSSKLKQSSSSTSTNFSSQQSARKLPSDIKHIPLRDRVIHLLALKSYTKPELLLRLKRDGLLERDKNLLGPTLSQVASLNVRENSYTLQRHLYTDVTLDWPHYTPEDKQLLTRKRDQMLQTSSSELSPSVSPSPAAAADAIDDSSPSELQSKRRRIAHTGTASRPAAATADEPAVASVNTAAILPTAATAAAAKVSRLRGRPSISDRESATEKNKKSDGGEDTSTQPDYLKQYVEITSVEQKKRYRRDFDSEYSEYCRLHERVFPHTQTFEEFNRRLSQHTPGSPNYQKLRDDVLKEYSKLKSDVSYLENRQRFEYLHGKLAHIKKLVQDFDTSNKGQAS